MHRFCEMLVKFLNKKLVNGYTVISPSAVQCLNPGGDITSD